MEACLRVLEAHGWVQVPVTHNRVSFFTHGEHLLDRIEVAPGGWSHQQFDGTSWLKHSKTRGDDAAGLDAYLTKHFPRRRK
jgi:hypothetical protein